MEALKHYRTWAIVVSCCMIALGVAMIVWPDISALTVCYLMGVLCVAMGVCEIARYFRLGVVGILFRFDLTLGILSVLAGVLLLRRFGLGSWGLTLVFGIVGAVLGVLMILNPFDGAAALMLYIGISMLITGAESIYTVICLSRAFKSEGHQKVIDAVWHEV